MCVCTIQCICDVLSFEHDSQGNESIVMHHAFGQGNKMPLSGFTVQWPLIQTVADKALTFINYHHLYYHCHIYRNHQHHYITTNCNVG